MPAFAANSVALHNRRCIARADANQHWRSTSRTAPSIACSAEARRFCCTLKCRRSGIILKGRDRQAGSSEAKKKALFLSPISPAGRASEAD